MKIVKIVDAVFINGVAATIGTDVKAYDMVDARQGVVEFENGTQLAYTSTRLVDLEEPVLKESIPAAEVTPENPSPTEPEVSDATEKEARKTK